MKETSDQFGSTDVEKIATLARAGRGGVQHPIVGNAESIDHATIALLRGGHTMINDVPGTGKTTLEKALAATLGCGFKRIQFTPNLVPDDIVGSKRLRRREARFRFSTWTGLQRNSVVRRAHSCFSTHPVCAIESDG